MPLSRRAAASAAASTSSSKSIVPTTAERFAGSATNGRRDLGRLGPAVEVRRRWRRERADAPVEAAVVEHPLELVGEQDQGAERGRVVGLVLARVVERGGQREELGLPAPGRPVELADPLDRGRAHQREPEAALGAEALLRGEVVGVGVGDVDRQPAGARGGVDQDQGVARALRAAHGHGDPGRGLVVGPGDHVGGGIGARLGRVAGLGLDDDRVREERRAGGHLRELRRELAVGEVEGALADQAGRRRVPEGGRAAVAEQRPRSRRARRRAPRCPRAPGRRGP